jgi:thiol-disulfide isomerase/thioredoxin
MYYKESLMHKPFFLLILVIIILTGCRKEEPAVQKEELSYKIETIDDVRLNEIINNRMGKALFINVWATWCVPCIEEFPDIVRIAEHYEDSDVEVVSLNVDMSSQVDSLVIPFMKSFDADFPVYNIREKSAEKVINLLNNKWSGAIPATFIYDKNGKQRIFILGSEQFARFQSAVDSVRSL